MPSRRPFGLASAVALFAAAAQAATPSEEINLLSWGAGALVVPPAPSESSQGQWSADELLDEMPDTGWANPRGDLTPKALVFELAAKSRITSLVFDTAQVYSKERAAKDVKVELSDQSDGGFEEIAKATLEQMKDGQRIALPTPASGRYLRLTVLNGYGDASFMEIMNFKAFGAYLVQPAMRDYSGTYQSANYGKLHLLQTGNSVVGCYEP